jgi:hypothetical protein
MRRGGGILTHRTQDWIMNISDDFASKEFGKWIGERDTGSVDVDLGQIIIEGDITDKDHGKDLKEHCEIRISTDG